MSLSLNKRKLEYLRIDSFLSESPAEFSESRLCDDTKNIFKRDESEKKDKKEKRTRNSAAGGNIEFHINVAKEVVSGSKLGRERESEEKSVAERV